MNNFKNIIGNGMIAKEFAEKSSITNYTIFASGVSNSKEINKIAFEREEILLNKVLRSNSKGIIYFSTTSIYDSFLKNSNYVTHKIKMEQIISNSSLNYYIIRLPQIIGNSGNSNNLCNFLYESIKNSKEFCIQKGAKRNIIDVSDLVFFVDNIVQNFPDMNDTVSIGNTKFHSIIEIVKTFERILNKKAKFSVINGGESQDFPVNFMKNVLDLCNYNFSENYLYNTLSKYYQYK